MMPINAYKQITDNKDIWHLKIINTAPGLGTMREDAPGPQNKVWVWFSREAPKSMWNASDFIIMGSVRSTDPGRDLYKSVEYPPTYGGDVAAVHLSQTIAFRLKNPGPSHLSVQDQDKEANIHAQGKETTVSVQNEKAKVATKLPHILRVALCFQADKSNSMLTALIYVDVKARKVVATHAFGEGAHSEKKPEQSSILYRDEKGNPLGKTKPKLIKPRKEGEDKSRGTQLGIAKPVKIVQTPVKIAQKTAQSNRVRFGEHNEYNIVNQLIIRLVTRSDPQALPLTLSKTLYY